jgi:ATP-dependent helicase HrpB
MIADLQPLSRATFLVASELDDQGMESRIFLAAPIELSELQDNFQELMTMELLIAWDKETQSVRARQCEFLGAIMFKETFPNKTDPAKVLAALLLGIQDEGLAILPWTRAAKQLQERLCFMHLHDNRWPDASDAALKASLDDWLAPHVYGMKSRSDLQRLNLYTLLEGIMSWEQRNELNDFVPTHITVPSGSRIPVDYNDPSAPALAVRLQEMFGLGHTPRIAGGKVALTLHLLSPAQRPVQVTRDLSSFWRDAYFEVKKDLKGRYPKHYWPDDPLAALPTNRAKPRA